MADLQSVAFAARLPANNFSFFFHIFNMLDFSILFSANRFPDQLQQIFIVPSWTRIFSYLCMSDFSVVFFPSWPHICLAFSSVPRPVIYFLSVFCHHMLHLDFVLMQHASKIAIQRRLLRTCRLRGGSFNFSYYWICHSDITVKLWVRSCLGSSLSPGGSSTGTISAVPYTLLLCMPFIAFNKGFYWFMETTHKLPQQDLNLWHPG